MTDLGRRAGVTLSSHHKRHLFSSTFQVLYQVISYKKARLFQPCKSTVFLPDNYSLTQLDLSVNNKSFSGLFPDKLAA